MNKLNITSLKAFIVVLSFPFIYCSCSKDKPESGKREQKIIARQIDISKTPSNRTNIAEPLILSQKDKGAGYVNPNSEWRRKGIISELDKLTQYQPVITKLSDDPVAFKEFEDLYKSKIYLPDYLPKDTNCEFEAALCEETIKTKCCEKLCLNVPNPCGIAMLTEIYYKYPGSESAPTSLLMISKILRSSNLGNALPDPLKSSNDVLYIIKRYFSGTWQAYEADYIIGLSKLKNRLSPEKENILNQTIKAFEDKDVLNNKYFNIYMKGENGIAWLYFEKAELYIGNGRNLGKDSIKLTGHLSPESIAKCKKGFDIFAEAKAKYPNAKELFYNKNGIPSVSGSETCYNMIHRLGPYKDK